MPLTENEIIKLVEDDTWMMDVLRAAQSLQLPDWMIGAGFIRNKVWDHLHGFAQPTPLSDIDLMFFDPSDVSWDREIQLEEKAKSLMSVPWSIKNQARMHINLGNHPYASSLEALEHWADTPTCTALRLDDYGKVVLIAPFGIEDLANLRVAPNPKFPDPPERYNERLAKKQWHKTWPKLTILPPQ